MVQKILFVAIPAVALLLSAPIVTEVLPYELRTQDYHLEFWLIGGTAAAGLVSAPGYLLALFALRHAREKPLLRWWVLTSLVVGTIASVVGAAYTIFAFWPLAVLPIGAALMCVCLLLRLRLSEGNAIATNATTATP